MNMHDRVAAVLRGEHPDCLPFVDRITVWFACHSRAGTIPPEFAGMTMTEIHRAVGMGQQQFVVPYLLRLRGVELVAHHDGQEIVQWNETVGSAITATIEIVHDSVTNITDQQIWMEVQYLGTSGTPLALFVDDAAADYITAAADQADSSASWTTTGLTNPNTQKLVVTFTPQEIGIIRCRVVLAKPSYTIYVDPLLTVA